MGYPGRIRWLLILSFFLDRKQTEYESPYFNFRYFKSRISECHFFFLFNFNDFRLQRGREALQLEGAASIREEALQLE